MAEAFLNHLAGDCFAAESAELEPGRVMRLHWPFPDPSNFIGATKEKTKKTCQVRGDIREKIRN